MTIYHFVCAVIFGILALCDRDHDRKLGERDELDLIRREQKESKEALDEIGKIMNKFQKKKDEIKQAFDGVTGGI
jgi:hypothetical protein